MDQEPQKKWSDGISAAWGRVRWWVIPRLPPRLQIRIHQKALGRIDRDLDKARVKRFGKDDYEYKLHVASRVTRNLNDAISILQTRLLLSEARNLHLPLQDLGNSWEETPFSGSFILTEEAQHRIRAAIRQEKKDRSELLRLWLAGVGPVISALTGLIGAAIGLVALLTK